MLSAILLVLRSSGHFRIDSQAIAGTAFLHWALAWGVTFFSVSLSDEFAFRGFWLFSLSRRMRFWPAALFLSAIFGVTHLSNSGENVLGILQVVATGLLFCLMIRCTIHPVCRVIRAESRLSDEITFYESTCRY